MYVSLSIRIYCVYIMYYYILLDIIRLYILILFLILTRFLTVVIF